MVNPWLIGAICLLGAGFIGFWCSYARTRWPLTILSILMAVIALQLLSAYRGDGTYHDLSAFRAMMATVAPGLLGAAVGIVAGSLLGQGLIWRSWWGLVTVVGFGVAVAAVVSAGLV